MITLPKKSTKKLLKLNQHKIRLGLERVNKAADNLTEIQAEDISYDHTVKINAALIKLSEISDISVNYLQKHLYFNFFELLIFFVILDIFLDAVFLLSTPVLAIFIN